MLGKFVIAYIDDNLMYLLSLEEQINCDKKVLSCLLEKQIYVKEVWK